MSYTSSPFSQYLGALELQFALGPFYKFVALYLMVLYLFESIDLDDYNLIYRQNKNMSFTKILTAIPLKTQHSPLFFYNHSSKFIMEFIQNNSIILVLVVWNLIPQNPRCKSYEFNQRSTNSSKTHINMMIPYIFYTNWGFTHKTSTNQGFV